MKINNDMTFTNNFGNDINTPSPSSSHLSPIKLSPVFDTYWHFAAKRQDIFFKRLENNPQPWTDDPILIDYKFTNAYRASDRVSQYLIKNVIYRNDLPNDAEEVLFRILLFKLFNKIETWELLEKKLGSIIYRDYQFDHYNNILSQAIGSKKGYIQPLTLCHQEG